MLRTLSIQDMLLIDRLELAFQPGLNVLTGETGAGKSILLDCLGFVLGWRGRGDLIRQGAAQGLVEAGFELEATHPALEILLSVGIVAERDEPLILRRSVAPDGRKQAWVNDRRVSGDTLRSLSDVLVELHGQHDDRGLLDPRGHRVLLDAFAGTEPLLSKVRAQWQALVTARKAEAGCRAELAALQAEEAYLRHAVAELDGLAPEPGEEAALDARRRQMQGGQRLLEELARAVSAVQGDGAEGRIADAIRWLESAATRGEDVLEGRLDAPLAALSRALIELSEAQSGIESALEALTFEPQVLEGVEERLFAIRALARKHAVLPDELAEHAASLRMRLSALDRGARNLGELTSATAAAEAAHQLACSRLSAARREAASRLDVAMAAELAPLKMDRAVFATALSSDIPGPEGADAVGFTVATNPGAPAGPLGRIASGGELSRFLLALKVCLTRDTRSLTLIFDEIDRGVGGATADAVGRRLRQLAEGAQVLVVTHSPQVAALGAHHWQVSKHSDGAQTISQVVPLDRQARIDELARMLSGDTVTDAARAAARALMES